MNSADIAAKSLELLKDVKPVALAIDETAPASHAAAVTPSNDADLTTTPRALYVGGAGNVEAIIGGTTVVFASVPAGTILPIAATRVKAANTTATNIIALW